MRCKENDMAVVIYTPPYPYCKPQALADALREQVLGQFVRVVRLGPGGSRGPNWEIETVIRVHYDGQWVDIFGIADCDLQPIRGAGLAAEKDKQQPEPAWRIVTVETTW